MLGFTVCSVGFGVKNINTLKSVKAIIVFTLMCIVSYFLLPTIKLLTEQLQATGSVKLILSIVIWSSLFLMIIGMPILVFAMPDIKLGNALISAMFLFIMAFISPFILMIITTIIENMTTGTGFYLGAAIFTWIGLIVMLFLPSFILLKIDIGSII